MTVSSSTVSGLRVVVATPLGCLSVTERLGSIVEVQWSKDAPSMPPSPLLEDARDQIRSYFDRARAGFELPLAPVGSSFDGRIWKEISTIPYGATATYGEIARRLGTSPRAIGGACGRNPIVLVIPCHRVVGANGRLTGYSGGDGLGTKAALLDHERRCRRAADPAPIPLPLL